MEPLSLRKKSIVELVKALRPSYQVFGPVRQDGIVHFKEIEDGGDIDWSFQNSRLSPKSLFLPQSQGMFAFHSDPAKEDPYVLKEVHGDDTLRVVIGMRPCDAKALQLVDANFDTQTYQDPWWVKAREATTLVGMSCTAPCSTCFCTSVGGGPCDGAGLDVLLTEVEDGYLVKVFTQKGKTLTNASNAFQPAKQALVERGASIEKAAASRIVSQVDTSKLEALDMLALHQADFWEDVEFACINCGTCTFLCPTCWCFDIQDETFGLSGIRLRNWDSCMFPLFTLHASGHNPRGQKVQRVRQRFLHKLKYFVDKYGIGAACVGCGRCVQHCPVNIDIRQVCQRMNRFGT
jgi:ferredoxin